jgi:hypothetical protein
LQAAKAAADNDDIVFFHKWGFASLSFY